MSHNTKLVSFAPRLYKIGVTGGIATGKSSALSLLNKSGYYTIDCDKLGHNTYKPDTVVYKQLIDTFGPDILTPNHNFIDRKKLAKLVFGHDQNILTLNRIVWPAISHFLQKKLLCLESQGATLAIVEAALLYEAGWDKYTDEVWVLGIPEEEAIKRVKARGLAVEDAVLRIRAQLSLEERRKRCDFFIDTFSVGREENYLKITQRIEEIKKKLQDRRIQTGEGEICKERNGGLPVECGSDLGNGSGSMIWKDCNPVECECPYLSEETKQHFSHMFNKPQIINS